MSVSTILHHIVCHQPEVRGRKCDSRSLTTPVLFFGRLAANSPIDFAALLVGVFESRQPITKKLP